MSFIASEASAVDLAPTYAPGPVERCGRRLKMEYVGMASVFAAIWALAFRPAASVLEAILATAAFFFLFLGLKKKTRDHLSVSLLLFAVAATVRGVIFAFAWALPFLLLAMCVWALEGYLEKRQSRIVALPAILAAWGWVDPSWLLGLVYAGCYLGEPWLERPGLRQRLAAMVALGGFGAAGAAWLGPSGRTGLTRLAPDAGSLILLAGLWLPALLCLFAYWRRLGLPHRASALLFVVIAPFDLRLAALSLPIAAIVLAATALRQSVDSERWRPLFKHAEWHFFWYVLAVAVWAVGWGSR